MGDRLRVRGPVRGPALQKLSATLLALCIIVKNEERNLQACLDSVRGVASEIVVVDTGSSDTTPQIAARNRATVVPFDFSFVDFAAARNQSIARATGRWILVLDADETLDAASIPAIATLIGGDENVGYYVTRQNQSRCRLCGAALSQSTGVSLSRPRA